MFTIKTATLAAMLSSTLILSACSIAPAMTEQETELKDSLSSSSYMPASRTMRDNIETQELFAQAAFWSREYDLNPSDLEATLKLASSVRKLGNPARAVEITQMGRALYPRDPYLGAEYAAALISTERANEASPVLDEMLRIAPGYARLWSLKGAALDQMEDYDLARKHYARALQITPHDPNILTNIGLSHALAGDAATAEGWLRRAAAIPGAGPAVSQNLALVLRLQGKSEEADKYARRATTKSRMPMTAPAPQKSASNYSSRSRPAPQASRPQPARPQTMRKAPATSKASFAPAPRNVMQGGSSYESSSQAARAAAQRAAERNTRQVTSPEQLKAQQELLAQMASGQTPQYSNTPSGYPQQAAPQQAAPQQAWPQPSAQPQYRQPQPSPQQNNRAARRRR